MDECRFVKLFLMANSPTDPRFYQLRNAAYTDLAAARELIANDASIVEAKNSIGETALHFLVVENQLEAVKFLAQAGSDVNNHNDFGTPAIIEAAQLGYGEMVELLLKLGANGDLEAIEAAIPDVSEEDRAQIMGFFVDD